MRMENGRLKSFRQTFYHMKRRPS
ncbi:hypothetical protein CFP56_025668 [Quercus suber]|uniref:Ribosomal protein L16 n=1 Tax=Quercus suber TaxID=58331 RepID=A0AAW0K4G4_QUESU